MKPIQDIRPIAPKPKKPIQLAKKAVEAQPLDREAFTKRINELAARLNYQKQDLSRKERFLRAINRMKG